MNQTCKNCVHWHPYNEMKNMGSCIDILSRGNTYTGVRLCSWECDNCSNISLSTGANFSCLHYKQAEEVGHE